MIPVNRRLGHYDVIRKVARGGMADVYLGQDDNGRKVALKVIEKAPDSDTVDAIEAERRGSALQERLAAVDSRVVRIYETGDLDDYFFVAMEYVEGEDLAEEILRGPIAPARACEIAIAILETLQHAHDLQAEIDGKVYHGIVHGDIKPRNIRIDPEGRVRVLDFGIAKALSLSRKLTRNEFGSVPYASPERLDSGEVDFMSDLWSVAVVLYEMITGLQPYQAVSTERLESMVRSRIPPPPAPEPCPEALRRILIKAMSPDPERRYQSATEFAADLLAFGYGGKVRATEEQDQEATRRTVRGDSNHDGTRRTIHAAPPPPPAGPQIIRPARPRRGTGRFVARAFGILGLTLAIWGGYWCASTYLMWQRGQKLEEAIKSEALTDPEQIWKEWTELSDGRASSLWLYGPRRAVRKRLTAAADNVIDTYRDNDTQQVRDGDWKRAHGYLAKALLVDPGDDSIRGKLRLCEGHIARIDGTVHKNQAQLYEAVAKFNEAQHLMPKSPDPQLGLARLYVYGLRDIDKADAALRQAERHGHKPGARDKAQLADGYRQRADLLWRDTENVRGLPQEKDEVEKVVNDYRRALELYQAIAPYGNAGAMIAKVQSTLDAVQYRLQQLEDGAIWR
ncbi:MAG TPA: serine/threonine-protein kinase [Burkholderiales bacterium]|nr:serine/threonine-protein kinase [Burkholderiales bacterium]